MIITIFLNSQNNTLILLPPILVTQWFNEIWRILGHKSCIYYGKNRKNDRLKKSLVLSTKQVFEGGKILIKGSGYNKDRFYEIETYYKSPNGNNKWGIPIVKPIEFDNKNILPIDPYLLGLGLGDGSFKNKNIKFSVHKDDYDSLFSLFELKENIVLDVQTNTISFNSEIDLNSFFGSISPIS
jgi:hypothetical protein